jgi:pyridoxal phosphate enzyme (YggS family)
MYSNLPANLADVRERIANACAQAGRDPESIHLIAVSKRLPMEALHSAVSLGLFDLGENRVQEALEKQPLLDPRARLHLIGSLQANKVNKAVGVFETIQSVDRRDLVERIERRAAELGTVQRIFLQVNISSEEQKGGCDPPSLPELWSEALEQRHIEVLGLMGMAKFDVGEGETRAAFARLRKLAAGLDSTLALSMGMSGDFELAILEGATHIRVGTRLFGPRPT